MPTTPTPFYLRLSVTEGCNLRCKYCKPSQYRMLEARAPHLPDRALLELVAAIRQVLLLRKIRITGGEPLMRPRLVQFVRQLHEVDHDVELAMTTNATLLSERAVELCRAGLSSVNLSLDTTRADRFRTLTEGGDLNSALAGIRAARRAGFGRIKLNTVLMRSVNGDHLDELVRVAADFRCEIRFIELMPIGAGARIFERDYLPATAAKTTLDGLFRHIGAIEPSSNSSRHLYEVDGVSTAVGFIAPVSQPFCSSCDRLRLDSRGRLYPCLRGEQGIDLARFLDALGGLAFETAVKNATLSKGTAIPSEHVWPKRSMAETGG